MSATAICAATDFQAAVKAAVKGVTGQSQQPVQNCLLLEVEGQTMHLTGTDLEVSVTTSVPLYRDYGRWQAAVPGRVVSELAPLLGPSDIILAAEEGHALNVESAGSHFTFKGWPAADFCKLPPPNGESITTSLLQETLRTSLSQVAPAASTDSTRPALSAVLFDQSDSGLELVATDAYRLAAGTVFGGTAQETSPLLPRRTANILRALLDHDGLKPVVITTSPTNIRFDLGNTIVDGRLVEGTPSNWRRVLPDALPTRITIRREALVDGLSRVWPLTRDDTGGVHLRASGQTLHLSIGEEGMVGTADESLLATCVGPDYERSFNVSYLRKALTAIRAEYVVITCGGEGPLVLTAEDDESYRHVIMPRMF